MKKPRITNGDLIMLTFLSKITLICFGQTKKLFCKFICAWPLFEIQFFEIIQLKYSII